jgi:hypothetical protein
MPRSSRRNIVGMLLLHWASDMFEALAALEDADRGGWDGE